MTCPLLWKNRLISQPCQGPIILVWTGTSLNQPIKHSFWSWCLPGPDSKSSRHCSSSNALNFWSLLKRRKSWRRRGSKDGQISRRIFQHYFCSTEALSQHIRKQRKQERLTETTLTTGKLWKFPAHRDIRQCVSDLNTNTENSNFDFTHK